MTVFYAIPSAAPLEQATACLEAWRDMGYRTAAIYEDPARGQHLPVDVRVYQNGYPGYWASVNDLTKDVLRCCSDCQIIVTGGDDVWPDPHKRAEEIAEEFIEHFGGTLGVMQPQGDTAWSRNAKRIAWSPWLGREWCERAYGGIGPLWPEYIDLYGDADLHEVAKRIGLLWERADIFQEHRTWKRYPNRRRPAYLAHVPLNRERDKALFDRRRAASFPCSELLPA